MEYFSFVVYTLIFISILVPVAIVIFNFFDISFVALALFNAILPVKTTNIFEDSIKKVVDAIAPTAPTAASTATSATAATKPK